MAIAAVFVSGFGADSSAGTSAHTSTAGRSVRAEVREAAPPDVASAPPLKASPSDAAAPETIHVEVDGTTFQVAVARRDETAGELPIVAEYAPVAVDSLPVYRPEAVRNNDGDLVIVTKGELDTGESLALSMRRQGIDPGSIHIIARELRTIFDFRNARPGQRYRLGQAPDGHVLDFRYWLNREESLYLTWSGYGYTVTRETAELRPQVSKVAGVIESSLYDAIAALGERAELASSFAELFAWDIDFSRNVHPGDDFQILYERLYTTDDDGEEAYVRPGRILAARYRGEVGDHTIVYYHDPEQPPDVGGGYFRPDGSSVERAFLVAPLKFSRISSRFTRARQHPILNITRPHRGIDYAAAKGTPLWAVGDGTVVFAGWAGDSGNLVKIRHANGYISSYAHLDHFHPDLKVGQVVKQKQVIGYVGSTGLSTGPHVCFRVSDRGRYIDPMKIASPAGQSVAPAELEIFRHKRDELLAALGPIELAAAEEAL